MPASVISGCCAGGAHDTRDTRTGPCLCLQISSDRRHGCGRQQQSNPFGDLNLRSASVNSRLASVHTRTAIISLKSCKQPAIRKVFALFSLPSCTEFAQVEPIGEPLIGSGAAAKDCLVQGVNRAQKAGFCKGPQYRTGRSGDARCRIMIQSEVPWVQIPLRLASNDVVFFHQLLFRFLIVGVQRDTIHRTNLLALGLIIMAYAFGAEIRLDLVDLLARRDCAVRALRLTDITINAVISNDQ